jgi:hypothetical protein
MGRLAMIRATSNAAPRPMASPTAICHSPRYMISIMMLLVMARNAVRTLSLVSGYRWRVQSERISRPKPSAVRLEQIQ